MNEKKVTVDKAELRQLSEMLAIFQKLPQLERIAVQYYIKGRMDATKGNIEIPVNFPEGEANTNTAATL